MVFAAAAALLAAAAASLLAGVEPPPAVSIVVAGDVMLSRNVAAKMKAAGDPLLPFRGVAALLDGADASFANLESPLAPPEEDGGESEWDGTIGGKSLIFAAPHAAVQGLTRHKFRILAMANNHAMDQEEDGLLHSIGRLAASGIQVAGAGRSLDEAWRPRMIEVRGLKIGFVAASYASLNYGTEERTDTVALIQDLDRMASSVRAARARARYVVVAMHAGDEYTAEPNAAQVRFARAAVDAGADVVAGSHPHWLQPVERYKAGLIFYSLGNFVFDLDTSRETREGAAVKLLLGVDGGLRAEVVPVVIENSCCPRPADPAEAAKMLRRMKLTSARIAPSR